MIPRVTKGASARGALGYDFGPGRREEHEDPRTVAGNVPGTWRDQADLIDAHTAQRPDLARPIWRSSLRAAPEDRALSDVEWGQVAERYAERMGFADAPWTATRHGEDHIHVTASRLDWNGRVVSDSHDYARAQAVCRVLEREHHLTDASQRYDRSRPQVSHGEKERAERLGAPAEREQLRERLEVATARSGGTLDGYERALGEAGVLYRRNQASTGRVSGYSYGLDGHTDAGGAQVFYKGSHLGKDYRWGKVQQRLDGQTRPAQPVQPRQQDPQDRRQDGQADAVREQARSALERVRRNDVDQGRTGGRSEATEVDRGSQQSLQAPAPGARDQPRDAVEAAMARVREHEAARQERDRDHGVQR